MRQYQVKYYKGLGTSTSKEAQEYFKNLQTHVIKFKYSGSTDDDFIDLAFRKDKTDEWKWWLFETSQAQFVDHSIKTLTYTDFINKELLHFSISDNKRGIPSLVDGFKPS